MSENLVGLHIYAVRQKERSKKVFIDLAPNGKGAMLSASVEAFVSKFSTYKDEGKEYLRDWYVEIRNSTGFVTHGSVMYGSSGFSGPIVDRQTREVRLNREKSDMDIIPLYFRFWVPDHGNYALCAFQTFGSRSCVGKVFGQLQTLFNERNEGYILSPKPIVLTDISRFKNGEVKSIALLKKDFSSDRADNQGVTSGELLDLDVQIRAKRKQSLGTLGGLASSIFMNAEKSGLDFLSTTFDTAYASVQVGGKKRRVALIGEGKDTGKVDLSDDIEYGPNGFPTFESTSREVEALFSEITVREAGK
jgi:hypothetical protein